MENWEVAYLGLGSNIGDRDANLRKAMSMLESSGELRIIRRSSVYQTRPVGYSEQPDFLNMVIKVKSSLKARELLRLCLGVEERMMRKRGIRWGPRIIDIDLLLYDNLVLEDSELTLPHPEMTHRAFVLVPLLEIEPELVMPDGSSVGEHLAGLGNGAMDGVAIWGVVE